MAREETKPENFELGLVGEVAEANRCEHLMNDERGPYCGNLGRPGVPILNVQRRVCDSASLQLWCLDPNRCDKCIYYNSKP